MSDFDAALWLRDHPHAMAAIWVVGAFFVATENWFLRVIGAAAIGYPGVAIFRLIAGAP